MMRIAMLLLPLAAVAIAAPACAQSFVGQWEAVGKPPQGPETHELVTAAKSGDAYSVTAKLEGDIPPGTPEAGPGYDIVLDGDKFTYKRDVMFGETKLVLIYTGVVSGDTFTGTASVAGIVVPYTGTRVSAVAQPGG